MVRRTSSVLVVVALLTSLMTSVAEAQTPIFCDGRLATIVGTAGNDSLIGTPGADVIAALQGDDYVYGGGGDDVICGGKGDDLLLGGLGFDIIFGAQGDDEIYSAGVDEITILPGALDDTRGARIFAGAGNDIVYGSDRWDRMQGGPGHDRLWGFAGNDWMRGGPGIDEVVGHAGKDDIHGGSGGDLVLAEPNDSNVRAGAGVDFCPNLPGTANWRGCVIPLAVDPSDSTLPATPLPSQLAGGEEIFYVYLGFDAQDNVTVVGAHANLLDAIVEQQVTGIREVTLTPVTSGQALAIAQALLVDQYNTVIQIDAISPGAAFYSAAVTWGSDWLELNGWG
ncbi:MAG: hypothetical protein R8J94_10695 [Acidimicrobiia bacterium]|nr:hypothetical protein [Acidimicrobiia bacterium]